MVTWGGAPGASFPAHPEQVCTQRAGLGTGSADHRLCWSKVFPPTAKPAWPFSAQQSPVGCCGHSHLGCDAPPATHAPATRHTLRKNTTAIRCPRGTRWPGSSRDPQGASALGGASGKHLGVGGTLSIPSWPRGHVPCPALATALAGAINPCGASCSCRDPDKHFCREVRCSGTRNK